MSVSKIVAAAASGVGGATLDVDEVFSTFLYEGDGTPQSINNGVDLSGEGGLVWIKLRTDSGNHVLYDTARGATKGLYSNATDAEVTRSGGLTSFNSNGFSVGNFNWENGTTPAEDLVSWTWRKAPKFFDVVQFSTGGSAVEQTINHSLGSTPGMIIIKDDGIGSWYVWHRGIGTTQYLRLEGPDAVATYDGVINNVTSTSFTTDVGTAIPINSTAIAYLFAHNNNDGEFGPDSDQDIIKCGSYTGNGSTTGPTVNLGFEPQFIMYKNTIGTGNWQMHDVMRGIPTGSNDAILYANKNWAENFSNDWLEVNPTGFQIKNGSSAANTNGETYIYMAIRRGPLSVEDATKVFSVNLNTGGGNVFTTGFAGDMNLATQTSGNNNYITQRLTDRQYLLTDSTGAQNNLSSSEHWDKSNTTIDLNTGYFGSSANVISYTWRRAPGYFDVRAYDGGTTSISHGLGVVPEMIWVKRRDGTASWAIYHKDTGLTKTLQFDTNAPFTNTTFTGVFDETFRGQTSYTNINYNNYKYVAYLFATAPGVSKVGSYTGNGVSGRVIDCGFSNGARFVLIKGITSNGYNWCVWDSARGIVSGNDPKLELDTNSAQQTGYDFIDPSSSGFSVTAKADVNGNNVEYIFYAIA